MENKWFPKGKNYSGIFHAPKVLTKQEEFMEQQNKASEVYCPANAALNLLNERWTLHIVRALLSETKRFNEIGREIGLNPATLRERLRVLEGEEVVTRTVISQMPPHVEYALTEKGKALNCIFEALAEWGRTWMRPMTD